MIRLATVEDAASISAIQRASWLDTYVDETVGVARTDVLAHLDRHDGVARWAEMSERAIVFVACDSASVLGFVAPHVDGERHRVGGLYVAAAARGRGIGSELLVASLQVHAGHDIYVGVVSYNHRARAFYARHGFARHRGRRGVRPLQRHSHSTDHRS